MRILFLLTAMATLSQAQRDCYRGACYPPSSDLLLGRGHLLQASSTCGLSSPEIYCTPYEQRRMKCCPCDSRNPQGQLAHTIQDVLSSSGPQRWWQSKKDMNPVTLQLDLDNLYQLDNLVLSFKGPRPNALVIERTQDNGRTWQPARYMATDCQKSFPDVPTTTPIILDQTYCTTLPPTDETPYHDHTIEFSPLRQFAYAPPAKSQKVQNVTGLTGLRVRMTELGDVPNLPGRALSRFYALKEVRVMGSCMCHGHANRCLPEEFNNPQSNTIQVHPQCDCQHNTAGVHCERCMELYNDLPWKPAEEGNPHTCRRCECNNHAQRCHFDPAVYEASGQTSGGVCESCQHHTTGPKCDQCAPGYQPNPRSQMDRPDACIRCVCSAEGSLNGGRCDDVTGSCTCKAKVEGPRCDRCKRGHYGLSTSNLLGCSKCSCSLSGSLTDACDPLTGQCLCRPHFLGRTCDQCSKGYWKPSQSDRCEPCSCDPTRSRSDICDQLTGQCLCRPGFAGRTCNECPDNTYGDPLIDCQPCRCNTEGTLPEVCDKQTGTCLCRPGITGTRCDSCGPGRCDLFPNCDFCPSCFVTLNTQRKNLSSALEKLSPKFPSRPGTTGDLGNFGTRIRDLEASLNLIRDSISFPPNVTKKVNNALDELDKLRDQVDQVDNDLPSTLRTPDLNSDLVKVQSLLDDLTSLYKIKKDAVDNTVSPNSAGAFNTIKNAYDDSNNAVNKVIASGDKVKESADVRGETTDLTSQVQQGNTRDLNKLNSSMASQPDLTPVAKQVCGSTRSKPCTPLLCDGADLCPPDGSPPCNKGEKCVGALPLSKRANADAKDVKDRLDKLTGKITDTAEKLQKTQEKTNQVRQSAGKLSDKIKKARDDLEDDLKETRDIVTELKDFLSDPTSDPAHIQKLSDWILKAKLPLNLVTLKRKLDELKNLAENLPDSSTVLQDAEPQLDTARKLLEEAQDARDKALDGKDDVDKLLAGFQPVENSLSNLEGQLQDSMDLIDNLNNNLTQARDQLSPVEKALNNALIQIQPLKPKLDELKGLLQNGEQLAKDAQEDADKAEKEIKAANEELETVEKQLDRLKDETPTQMGGEEGSPADRLSKLMEGTGVLANNTDTMLKDLEGNNHQS
uniref:Laminin, beta 3 n=1 Tax=Salarias fasciatus TaxID=181472 RepID=A0A672F831_SALFA